MEKYVDGYVIPIAQNKLDDYKKMAELAGSVWKEHGALEYIECAGDDLNQKELVSFNKLAGATENETVIFAWIFFGPSGHGGGFNESVLAYPCLRKNKNCR